MCRPSCVHRKKNSYQICNRKAQKFPRGEYYWIIAMLKKFSFFDHMPLQPLGKFEGIFYKKNQLNILENTHIPIFRPSRSVHGLIRKWGWRWPKSGKVWRGCSWFRYQFFQKKIMFNDAKKRLKISLRQVGQKSIYKSPS